MAVTWKQIPYADEVAVLSSNNPANVNAAAAAPGTGTAASKDDHKHSIDVGASGVIVAITGAAADGGASNSVARADHRHALGPLVANLSFAGFQATDLVVHSSAAPPTTPVQGKVYYDTDDLHLYVCTSAI